MSRQRKSSYLAATTTPAAEPRSLATLWQEQVQQVQVLQRQLAAARRQNERLQAAVVAAQSERSAQRRELLNQQRLLLTAFDISELKQVPAAASQAGLILQQQVSCAESPYRLSPARGQSVLSPVIRLSRQQNIVLTQSGEFLGALQEIATESAGNLPTANDSATPVIYRHGGPSPGAEPAVSLPNGVWWLPVDIVGGLAQHEAQSSWSLSRLRQAGGIFLWPLLLIAAVALVIVGERKSPSAFCALRQL